MATILVTGGCGFIGGHLVRRLVARGDAVRVLDLDGAAPVPAGADRIVGDVRDTALVRDAMADVATVYHLAAIPELWRRDPADFERVNVEGTRTVIEAARRANARRVVHASTESIMKAWRGDAPPTLDDVFERLEPGDVPGAYCRSKLAADRLARQAARDGAPVVIVHPTMPIGPGDRRLTPPTAMVLGFLDGRHPAYYDATFNLVDVRDAAAGFVAAADAAPGTRIMLAGTNVGLGDLLRRLEALTGLTMPTTRLPYAVALGYAALAETWATLVSHRPPPATVAGVRLVRTPLAFDGSATWQYLGIAPTPLDRSLADLVDDLDRRGLLRRRPVLRAVPVRSGLTGR